MTLRKLRMLLWAVPDDCADLPVELIGRDGSIDHLWVIRVYPPDNAACAEPRIELRDHEFPRMCPQPVLITEKRNGM